MNEDLNDLRYVAAITTGGSLSAAARSLGVNHATVFRRITHLEAHLGVRLFERHGGRYVATAAGEELARAGSQIEETAAASLLKVAGRDLRPSGMVRISTTDSVASTLLNPIMVLCRARFPQITLQVSLENDLIDLARHDADIAVRPAMAPPDYLIGKRIGALALAVYGSMDYLAKHPGQDWAAHAWIALNDPRHRTVRWLGKIKPLDQVGYRINSFLQVRQACSDGLGLALMPCFLGDGVPGLQRVLGPVEALASEMWLLTHPDQRDTVRVKAVFQLLYEQLLKQAGRIAGQ